MAQTYRTNRRIEFADTDVAGIAHFSAFLLYMEQAEHEFLRSLGLRVYQCRIEGEEIGFPRVSVQCDYAGSATFEDVLDVELRIERLGAKSITYGFTFTHEGREVARGKTTCVCCHVTPGGPLVSRTIPESFAALLRPYCIKNAQS